MKSPAEEEKIDSLKKAISRLEDLTTQKLIAETLRKQKTKKN